MLMDEETRVSEVYGWSVTFSEYLHRHEKYFHMNPRLQIFPFLFNLWNKRGASTLDGKPYKKGSTLPKAVSVGMIRVGSPGSMDTVCRPTTVLSEALTVGHVEGDRIFLSLDSSGSVSRQNGPWRMWCFFSIFSVLQPVEFSFWFDDDEIDLLDLEEIKVESFENTPLPLDPSSQCVENS